MNQDCNAELCLGTCGEDNVDCFCQLKRGHEGQHLYHDEGFGAGAKNYGSFVVRWPAGKNEHNSREDTSPAVAPDGQHGATTRMTDARLAEIERWSQAGEGQGLGDDEIEDLLAEARRAREAEMAAYDRGMVEGFAQMRGQFARDLSDARSTAFQDAVGICEAEAKRCNMEGTAAHKRRESDRSFALGAAESTAENLAVAIGKLSDPRVVPAFTIHDDATRPDCGATRILDFVGKDRAANGATFDYTRPCSCQKATLPPDPAGPPCFDRFLCIVCGGLSREESVGCTGVSAVWCPVHGDCTCPTNGIGERSMNAPACPLHGASSAHGDGS